ncbi:MAG TPA: hypothetical protein VIN59_02465 [Alphaproteobacteria bacterium]
MIANVSAVVDMRKSTDYRLRKLVAVNQNNPMPMAKGAEPQWYDIKQLVEIMFDARSRVRDALALRRDAQSVHVRYNGHPGRPLITAEIHGINMQIALNWHAYRQASAAYHTAWSTYQENLKR